jgi:hypothetical protein
MSQDHDFLWQLNMEVYRAHIELTWGWDEAWQRENFRERMRTTTGSRVSSK